MLTRDCTTYSLSSTRPKRGDVVPCTDSELEILGRVATLFRLSAVIITSDIPLAQHGISSPDSICFPCCGKSINCIRGVIGSPFLGVVQAALDGTNTVLANHEDAATSMEVVSGAGSDIQQRATSSEKSKKRPISRIKSTYPRKRALQACQKCRVRRTKCNNVRPSCSSCLELNVQCIYSQEDPSRYGLNTCPAQANHCQADTK